MVEEMIDQKTTGHYDQLLTTSQGRSKRLQKLPDNYSRLVPRDGREVNLEKKTTFMRDRTVGHGTQAGKHPSLHS